MEYTVTINDRCYELPKKTLSVIGKLDGVLKVDSRKDFSARQKFEKLHQFIKEVLGDEAAREILGAENLEEIDLSDLSLTVLQINDAYNRPVLDYRTNKMNESLSAISADKIVPLINGIKTMESMPDKLGKMYGA